MNNKLNQLAKLYGIQTSYIDMKKQQIDADKESILLALRSLGAPVRKMGDVDKALRLRRTELSRRVLEPVIVAWNGRVKDPAKAKATLVLESGKTARWPPRKTLPMGYHRLIAGSQESLVISAPVRTHFPLKRNAWGVFAPVYALHSKRSFGAGDLTDFESLIEWMTARGGQVAATLPLLACFLSEPFEPSPYSPVSRIFWNEFYIDPETVPEFRDCEKAHRLLNKRPKSSHLVNYKGMMAIKRRILEALAETFFSQKEGRRKETFRKFLRSQPGVSDYARFRAITDRQRRGWHDWPDHLQKRTIGPGDWDDHVREYHLYAQWVIQEQIDRLAANTSELGALLYLDLPLGLHIDSYDTWRYREFFVDGISAGAPPDPVFTTGQNWAFPPMHPEAMRTNRYEYMIEYIRNHLQHARLLRIDHVMGLHRLYWIPEGLPGNKGLYVHYPAEEMYAILSLESHRCGAGIIGENLGVVPPEVDDAMALHDIRKLYVLQFATAVDSETVAKPQKDCVASLNTHDMFPFRAFLEGIDIDDRLDLGFLTRKEAAEERAARSKVRKSLNKSIGGFQECIHFLGKSKADIVLVNLEDLWGETKPQNIPATIKERPNWRRRMRYSIERLKKAKEINGILRKLDRVRVQK